jgi:hypothetical protein
MVQTVNDPLAQFSRREFDTAQGEIWLWGDPSGFDGESPLLIVQLGAFNIERRWPHHLAEHLPGVSVLVGQLPGNHCPPFAEPSVEAFAAAWSELIGGFAPRPVAFFGMSIAGTAGLAVRASNLRATVAVDPPMRTGAALWPLIPNFRQRLEAAPDDAALAAFLWRVFGVSRDQVEDRDFDRLLDAPNPPPTQVLFGDIPLMPPRELDIVPSLVDQAARTRFRAAPHVGTWRTLGMGHSFPDGAYSALVGAAQRAAALLV